MKRVLTIVVAILVVGAGLRFWLGGAGAGPVAADAASAGLSPEAFAVLEEAGLRPVPASTADAEETGVTSPTARQLLRSGRYRNLRQEISRLQTEGEFRQRLADLGLTGERRGLVLAQLAELEFARWSVRALASSERKAPTERDIVSTLTVAETDYLRRIRESLPDEQWRAFEADYRRDHPVRPVVGRPAPSVDGPKMENLESAEARRLKELLALAAEVEVARVR